MIDVTEPVWPAEPVGTITWARLAKGSLMTEEEAEAWWRRSRRVWGQLQQVRKGTRVRCPFCAGARRGCPMCELGFVGRDDALAHYETEMEFAHK